MTAEHQTEQKGSQAIKAAKIGSVCIITYVLNYYIRNILGVLTPGMVAEGAYTKEYLAFLASIYMVFYAGGQLINGFMGDVIKPKYMASSGLAVASLGLFGFAFVNNTYVGMACFAVIGFGLSMMRGPLVKVISENTLPKYARLCCVFLSFSSFAGPLLAGLAALVMKWHTVFVFSGCVSLAMAVICFAALTYYEKKGEIIPLNKTNGGKVKFNPMDLFKLPNMVTYLIVAMVVEIAAASINYWMPTFFGSELGMDETAANAAFSVISLLRATMPFVSLIFFKLLHERDILILRIFFTLSALMLLFVFFVEAPVPRLVFFTLSLMLCSVSSSTLWSIYIPSLAKSGKVSSANGFIDCIGYVGAALFNVAVVPIMETFGWSGTILSWSGIMVLGVLSTLFAKNNKQNG